jgi:hypothetical protein
MLSSDDSRQLHQHVGQYDEVLQMRIFWSLICAISVASCDVQRGPVIELAERPAMPDCLQLDDKSEQNLRPQAISFFLHEVGIDVRKLTVTRGSNCEGKVIFAMLVDEEPEDFLVSIDVATSEKKLMRPM